jgi:hypothetical protein
VTSRRPKSAPPPLLGIVQVSEVAELNVQLPPVRAVEPTLMAVDPLKLVP